MHYRLSTSEHVSEGFFNLLQSVRRCLREPVRRREFITFSEGQP
jgi:hypothetical protein